MLARAAQLRNLSDALVDCYAPGLNAGNYIERVFELMSRLVPSDLNAHGVREMRTRVLSASFDRYPPGLQPAFEAFGRLMHRHRPFRFDPAVNAGRPYSARDFYGRAQFRDLDIYQEVHGPMGFADHCFVHIPTGPEAVLFLGLFRAGGVFDAREKELLALAQPHLANARRLAWAFTAAEDVPLAPEVFAQAGFTPRESDVIFWLTQGKTNDEIAAILHIRADSVSRHLQAIYEKMGVEHRVAATLHALDLARSLHVRNRTSQGGAISLAIATR